MACQQICSNQAISITYIKGFANPLINHDLCKKCNQCVNVCPILNVKKKCGNKHENEKTCFAGYNKNDESRIKSSSGGVFSVFAEKIISQGGVVFGAAWNDRLELEHKFIESVDNLDDLRRSKYVQSNIKDSYKETLAFLKERRKVLFCGTPCQIAGLKNFLGNKDFDNLLTVDILCQGVPSPLLFRKYISEVESKVKTKIIDCDFRSKKYGWRCGLIMLLSTFVKGKRIEIEKKSDENSFYNSFIREYFLRPTCYKCKFKNDQQGYYSDVTLADFWRIGNRYPYKVKNYEKGISAIVLNTEKGKRFLGTCSSDLVLSERCWDEFLTNGGLRSSHEPLDNDDAYAYLQSHSWSETQNKFFPVTLMRRFKIFIMVTLGEKNIRKIMKMMGKIR